jgi:hypothetical protein
MKLPLTSYDRLQKLRPEMWDFISQDVQSLRASGWQKPVFSFDDIGGGHVDACAQYLAEAFVQKTAERTGLPVETIRSHAGMVPEFLQQIKLLAKTVEQDYYNYLNFELFDKKTFFFSDNLTDNLAETEIEIDPALVRPPFDCSLFVFTADSIINAACAAFDGRVRPESPGGVVSVMVVYHPDRQTKDGVEFNSLLMAISYWEGYRQVFYIKREVALFSGGSIEKALKTEWNDLLSSDELGAGIYSSLYGEDRATKDEEFYTDGLHLFRIVLNAVLYLGSSEPDIVQKVSAKHEAVERAGKIKSRAKAKLARQEANRESALDFASVGGRIEPIVISSRSGSGPLESSGRGRSIFARFIVRGHWRNQAHGEGRTQRKIIWIKPHFKGPEITEVVNRPYAVK